MMRTGASPFAPRTMLTVLGIGAAALVLFLYAVGAGWDGRRDRNAGAHAAANGLNGFAGLVRLLEAQGQPVSLSRSEARLDEPGLLVLTPQVFADAADVDDLIRARRYAGPTLVILPKWFAVPADDNPDIEAPNGWVMLGGATAPEWIGEMAGLTGTQANIVPRTRWQGMGRRGTLPDPNVVALSATMLAPLIRDEQERVLAGFVFDGGTYPVLSEAAGRQPKESEGADEDLWPVVVVAEPDLMNNYGLADPVRARAALALVQAAREGDEGPIVFDLTAAGLARSENLLTLAFTPPFVAATVCLLFAAAVIAWRGFRRFGPPVAEAPALAMGKRQLARNGAALVERARRLHLLGPPYAALVTARIADALAIREADREAREQVVSSVLAARGLAADYSDRANALRRARRPAELLRAAGALRAIERTVT